MPSRGKSQLPPAAISPAASAAPVPPGPSRSAVASHARAVVVHGRARAALHLLGEGLVCLAHLRVAQVHLAVEVVGEAAVVVEPAEVGAADVADLQLLVARGTGRVGEGLELLLAVELGLRGLAHAEELVLGARDFGHGAEDLDFEEAVADGRGEFGDALELCVLLVTGRNKSRQGAVPYQNIGLTNLVRRLLQPPLRSVDAAVALVNVLLQVAHVVVLEAVLLLLAVAQRLVLGLDALGVHLGTRADVLLGVGEEVVRTGAGEVRPADFRVRHGELGGARRRRRAHELLEQLPLFGGHGGVRVCRVAEGKESRLAGLEFEARPPCEGVLSPAVAKHGYISAAAHRPKLDPARRDAPLCRVRIQ